MHGATMTRNIRRTGVRATIKGKANPEYPDQADGFPTRERLAKSDDAFSVGGDDRTGRRYVMQDSPLDRAFRKGIISGSEHSALQKYRHHWYHAGQAPTIGSVDLNRIFSAEPGGVAGMPKTEGQIFHRQRWREAQECLGLRSSAIVDKLVCREETLELCGQALGFENKPQAISAASVVLSDAGYRLARLWGIG